ncbi:MAG: hypothetical protein Q8K70_12985 [Bacteroidota bacterium]|nr:hypothetical protein [Bacteroidota bacterium]
MKKNIFSKIMLLSIATTAILFTSCKKDDDTGGDNTPTKGTVKLEFEHKWGMNLVPFSMGVDIKQPKTGDTLKFTTLKYYVSNIKFKKSDGTWWSQDESYHLVDASIPSSLIISIADVPIGTYTEMQYTMGVDSIRNVSGAQTGALSTANGMFWNWNSGYIMTKAEGMSPNSPSGDYALHLGGFQGEFNVVTVKSTDFGGEVLNVSPSATPQIHLVANPAKFWHTNPGVKTISKIHMPGANAKQAAKDFYDGIFFDHIHP